MPMRVTALHHVTVDFCLRSRTEPDGACVAAGRHRFLYGVESWIAGIDQQLEGLAEGESLELLLESETGSLVASHLSPRDELAEVEQRLSLELKIVQVEKAEPREVIKALAASVRCCDHCGGH